MCVRAENARVHMVNYNFGDDNKKITTFTFNASPRDNIRLSSSI